jgi:hypothetical protein
MLDMDWIIADWLNALGLKAIQTQGLGRIGWPVGSYGLET